MNKILITTTDSLFGWEIENYLRPIFSNVVVGAGLLSDFSASLTDIFGGRSNSYEKKLQAVNDSALQLLKSKASEIGANCILGLKVNVHQISGKNVQMFMVSAYGTAVIAKSVNTVKAPTSTKEIDKTTITDTANLIHLLENFKDETFKLSQKNLELIVESKSSAFRFLVFAKMKTFLRASYNMDEDTRKHVDKLYSEYYGVIEPHEAIEVVYPAIEDENDDVVVKRILLIIENYDLVDFNCCNRLLLNENLLKKKLALRILSFDKAIYLLKDITDIESVMLNIHAAFPDLSVITTKKGFLSSNEKEVWQCNCGKSNDLDEIYCINCAKNKFGFESNEIKPETILQLLDRKRKAIKELLETVY